MISTKSSTSFLYLSATFLFLNGCSTNHLNSSATQETLKMTEETTKTNKIPLPDYVVINNDKQSKELRSVLRTRAAKVTFPLSPEDQSNLDILAAKYDQEQNIAGLAAPQVGIGKQMIIFAAPDDENLKKMRPELTQTIGRTIWVNPSYEPIGDETHTDYEGCFSVHNKVGLVSRYQRVRVTAQNPDGTPVNFEAEGFLARIIQHEIDHLNSTLCIDKADPDSIMSMDEYIAWKKSKIENKS